MKTALWWILFALANTHFAAIRGPYLASGTLLVLGLSALFLCRRDEGLTPGGRESLDRCILFVGLVAWGLPPLSLI